MLPVRTSVLLSPVRANVLSVAPKGFHTPGSAGMVPVRLRNPSRRSVTVPEMRRRGGGGQQGWSPFSSASQQMQAKRQEGVRHRGT